MVPPEVETGTTGNIRSNRHEWLVGAEFSYPLGFRQGHAAVRNSQLRLSQERALFREMQRQVAHDVGNALSNVDRSFRVLQAAFNRRVSAQRRYSYLSSEELQAARKVDFNLVLDADRRLAESESSYHRACVDYALAIKNLNFEMGALLDYCNVHLATDAPINPLATKANLDYTITH